MFLFSLGDYAERKSPLLKIFADAEAAANSAAIQLVSFKDAMEDEFAVCLLTISTYVMYQHVLRYTVCFDVYYPKVPLWCLFLVIKGFKTIYRG